MTRHRITYSPDNKASAILNFYVQDWMTENSFAFTEEEWARLQNPARPRPEPDDLPGDILRRLTSGLYPSGDDHWALHQWIRPPRYPHHVAIRCRDDFQIAQYRHLYLPGKLETILYAIAPETDYDIGMTFRRGMICENPMKSYPTRSVCLIDFVVGFPNREVADRFREAIGDHGN